MGGRSERARRWSGRGPPGRLDQLRCLRRQEVQGWDFVVEGNSSFELFTSDFRLRKALQDLGCNLWVVKADPNGGLVGGTKWLQDRPELTYESLRDLFTNRQYRIPASSGALKKFEPAIAQFEGHPGNKRTPKDIISARVLRSTDA